MSLASRSALPSLPCQNRTVTSNDETSTPSATLHELARAHGIATSYQDSDGRLIEASAATLSRLLNALGVDASDPEAALAAHQDAAASRPLPGTVVTTAGFPYVFACHVHDGAQAEVWIELEDGGQREVAQRENFTPPRTVDGVAWGEASFEVPADLPQGWHRLRLRSAGVDATATLVVTPERLSSAARVAEQPTAGMMAQLYSVRSRGSWGIGDFRDLGELAVVAARHGFDFLLTNPLHAAEPFPPVEDSPYLPSSRRFINPIYLRIEDVPEYAGLDPKLRDEVAESAAPVKKMNTSADFLERDVVYAAKLAVLRELHNQERPPERAQAFARYVESEGDGLIDFARWCADQELTRADGRHSGTHAADPQTPEEYRELVDFYLWLQFLCDEQLAGAQRRAKAAGMSIGIVADLAVGTHPGGADAAVLRDYLAPRASVGAPPDGYNQQGQDWSQPPWHPQALADAGYQPWRDLLRTILRHAGGIRVDHILGLFRLFWIPRGLSPQDGAYVSYDFEAMLGILVLEAERAGAVVIGEDLGTFEPWVREALAYRRVLGTSVLWFESDASGSPTGQPDYRSLTAASIGTHDLPPTAGFLDGEHIRLRDRLGLFTRDLATEDREDVEWQNAILDTTRKAGCFDDPAPGPFAGLTREERGETEPLIVALTRYVAGTSAALTITQLVDLVGDRRAQNQPGTTQESYPNWRVPLCDGEGQPVLLEELDRNDLFEQVSAAAQRPRSEENG